MQKAKLLFHHVGIGHVDIDDKHCVEPRAPLLWEQVRPIQAAIDQPSCSRRRLTCHLRWWRVLLAYDRGKEITQCQEVGDPGLQQRDVSRLQAVVICHCICCLQHTPRQVVGCHLQGCQLLPYGCCL
jgi:hypothetical protein